MERPAVLESLGLGAAFTHPAGYGGAGFAATDFAARPRLHPKSEDVLVVKSGMVLKLESGVTRTESVAFKTEMVAVTDGGPAVSPSFTGTSIRLKSAARRKQMRFEGGSA